MDETDQTIVTLLQKDGRTTNRRLADATGIAPSTAIQRVNSLHSRGIITGYHAQVDLAAIGRPVQALIAISIHPPSRTNIENFRDWVSALPETIGVFVTSGAQDFLVHVAVEDTDGLYAFVIDRLTERPEVANVNTSVVYAHLQPLPIHLPTGPKV
ncbi:Lrp/AsnC family transcriptional regulator [Arthrobacter sp. NamB2]|nr:Lrp/AsnC family transcriptional regulator [Arthrobacter sp. NamB2]